MSILESLKQHIPKSTSHRFLLTAMSLSLIATPFITKPIQTYAKSFVTADGTKWETVPGEIEWGGSAERQGVIFYLYNVKTHDVDYTLGTHAFMLLATKQSQGEFWQGMLCNDMTAQVTRVGAGSGRAIRVNPYTDSSIPYPSTYSEDGSWVSTGGDTKAYLEEEIADGRQRWEVVIGKKWGPSVIDKIKKDRGKTYRICMESVSAFRYYVNKDGEDYQMLNAQGKVYQVCVSNKFAAEQFKNSGVNIASRTGTGSTLGTANSKWLQSIANGMVFSDPEESKLVGVPIAQGGTVSTSEMYSQGYGFATIKPTIVPIHTFNGTTPSYPEEPKSDITDGECSIYKVYYTQEYDKKGREVGGYKHVYSYSKHQTTNYIVIDSERGYAVEKWLHF